MTTEESFVGKIIHTVFRLSDFIASIISQVSEREIKSVEDRKWSIRGRSDKPSYRKKWRNEKEEKEFGNEKI